MRSQPKEKRDAEFRRYRLPLRDRFSFPHSLYVSVSPQPRGEPFAPLTRARFTGNDKAAQRAACVGMRSRVQ